MRFTKKNRFWKMFEDRDEAFNKKYPNWRKFLINHVSKNQRVISNFCHKNEDWIRFNDKPKRKYKSANELFEEVFLTRHEDKQGNLKYESGGDECLIRHMLADVRERRGMYTIDTEGQILHEKMEMMMWIKKYNIVETALDQILNGDAYEKYYDYAHSPSCEVEFKFYQDFAGAMVRKFSRKKIPFKAFLFVDPLRDACEDDRASVLHSCLKFDYNQNRLDEKITKKDIMDAVRAFELGGYKYTNRRKTIENAITRMYITSGSEELENYRDKFYKSR